MDKNATVLVRFHGGKKKVESIIEDAHSMISRIFLGILDGVAIGGALQAWMMMGSMLIGIIALVTLMIR